jgi:hypothetical protein
MSWRVVACTVPGKYRLMARSAWAGTASSTGSDRAGAPAGMVIADWPPKLSVRRVDCETAELDERTPMLAAPMRSGVLPISLEKRTRTRLPPMLV